MFYLRIVWERTGGLAGTSKGWKLCENISYSGMCSIILAVSFGKTIKHVDKNLNFNFKKKRNLKVLV